MADKAASQVNASYGKMNAGYIKSAYHKEDVNHPKPLSIIRSNKLSGDALEEAYDMNEKMVMCEQCGKMHEEGACGEMNESEIHLDAKHDTFKKIKKSKWAAIKKKYNVTIDSDKTGSWAAGKPEDLHKFAMAMGMSKDDIKKTYNHITPDYKGASNLKNKQRESVDEAKEKKLSPTMKNNIHKIAKKHAGDMEAAMKEISMMKVWKGQGIKDHPYVMDALKRANETYDYGSDKAVKAAKKKTPGQKNESVDVDRRTKGFKEAMKRAEAAKKKREAYKKKKEAKKDQAELDARYDYDGEVDTILAAASKVMMGTNETAANAVAHGGVDMAPNAGKKKKKELLARRGY